ncbi:MAG: ketopantoate reductase family protein [bacterium]|nr:ketopantoate reductase family protein [bacterium]
MNINKVLICGLGAVGLAYANQLKDKCDLLILADDERIKKYKQNSPVFNGEKVDLRYVSPSEKSVQDLIIISTKYNGFFEAINYIKNYVGENTIILSLLNGISSEKEIAERYGEGKVIHSYYVGHSIVRCVNKVDYDGIGKIVFGSPFEKNKQNLEILEKFFAENNINYEISEDIIYSMWLKFVLNIVVNQYSAIINSDFGRMKHNPVFYDYAKSLIAEVTKVAKAENINNIANFETDFFKMLSELSDDGKSSMLQDILAKRKTEVEIFSGEIIRLGEKHNILTPFNVVFYKILKILEENY